MAKPLEVTQRSRPAIFWWTLANALALCYALLSWVFCLHVFHHPENPRNYAILRKLKRLPELTRRSAADAPLGTISDPRDLYKKFFGLDPKQSVALNERLMRNYINNIEQPFLVYYIEGDYEITDVRLLDEHDFFQPGVAVRARALVKPDDFSDPAPWPVVIEYLFPTEEARAVAAHFQKSDIMSVHRTPNCPVVLHVDKITAGDEQKLCLTVAPIAYGECQAGNMTFGTAPPVLLNPTAKFPVFSK